MKNLFHILLSAALAVMVAGCGTDGGDKGNETAAVVVLEAQTLYPQGSSSGTIKIDAQGTVQVGSNEDWCTASVSDNTITVAVAENRSIESRNATISITASGETVKVDIVQKGIYFIVENPVNKLNYMAGDVMVLDYSDIPYPITLVDYPSWVSASIDGNNMLTITSLEDNKAALRARTGYIVVDMLGYTKNIVIGQTFDTRSYRAFLGDYELTYNISYTGTSTWKTKNISLVELEEGLTYSLKGMLADESLGDIVVSYDPEARGLAVKGQVIHTDADGVDLWLLPLSANNYTSRSYNYGLVSLIDDQWTVIEFTDNGYVSTSSFQTTVGFRLRWYQGSTNMGNYAPFSDAMCYWQMKKI